MQMYFRLTLLVTPHQIKMTDGVFNFAFDFC